MMRRFFNWLRRRRVTVTEPAKITRVQTDLRDVVELHAGDWVDIERVHQGFTVFAYVLRDFELHTWPLYHCAVFRTAWDIHEGLRKALASGAVAYRPGAHYLEKEVAR